MTTSEITALTSPEYVIAAYQTAFRAGNRRTFEQLFNDGGSFTYVALDDQVVSAPFSEVVPGWSGAADPATTLENIRYLENSSDRAVVALDFVQPARFFHDVLVLVRRDGKWSIVSKVSHASALSVAS